MFRQMQAMCADFLGQPKVCADPQYHPASAAKVSQFFRQSWPIRGIIVSQQDGRPGRQGVGRWHRVGKPDLVRDQHKQWKRATAVGVSGPGVSPQCLGESVQL
jgi:hypothetical protein